MKAECAFENERAKRDFLGDREKRARAKHGSKRTRRISTIDRSREQIFFAYRLISSLDFSLSFARAYIRANFVRGRAGKLRAAALPSRRLRQYEILGLNFDNRITIPEPRTSVYAILSRLLESASGGAFAIRPRPCRNDLITERPITGREQKHVGISPRLASILVRSRRCSASAVLKRPWNLKCDLSFERAARNAIRAKTYVGYYTRVIYVVIYNARSYSSSRRDIDREFKRRGLGPARTISLSSTLDKPFSLELNFTKIIFRDTRLSTQDIVRISY